MDALLFLVTEIKTPHENDGIYKSIISHDRHGMGYYNICASAGSSNVNLRKCVRILLPEIISRNSTFQAKAKALRGFVNRVGVGEYPMQARATHAETSCLNGKINKQHDNV